MASSIFTCMGLRKKLKKSSSQEGLLDPDRQDIGLPSWERRPFRLLSLPAEIRLNIYRHCLVRNNSIVYRTKKRVINDETPSDIIEDSIEDIANQDKCTVQVLRLSRFVNREASPIFYSENSFRVKKDSFFYMFLKTVGTANSITIKHLDLDFDAIAYMNVLGSSMAERLPNIQSVSLCFDTCNDYNHRYQTENWFKVQQYTALHAAFELTRMQFLPSLKYVSDFNYQENGLKRRWAVRLMSKRDKRYWIWSSLQAAGDYFENEVRKSYKAGAA